MVSVSDLHMRAAESLSAEQVLEYLRATGWSAEPALGVDGERSVMSLVADDRSFRVMVPLDTSFKDFQFRLAEALSTIQEAKQLRASDLVDEIGTTRLDVIRIRAVQETGPGDSILLSEGRSLVEGAQKMLRAAAATTIRRNATISRNQPVKVTEFLDRVRLGQTQAGSYVITLITPIAESYAPTDQQELVAPTPFDREVTEHLSRALSAAKAASRQFLRTESFHAFYESVGDGVSAELCDSLIEMVSSAESVAKLDVRFSWAPLTQEPDVSNRVRFSRSDLEPLESASRRFKETEQQAGIMIRGLVEGVHRGENDRVGRVTVKRTDEEAGKKVRIPLSGDDFDAAADALKSRAYVRCVGDLMKEGNFTWLHNPKRFRVEAPLDGAQRRPD